MGSPYIDVSYRLLLPLSATLHDLQLALQKEIQAQQQKHLDTLRRTVSSSVSFSEDRQGDIVQCTPSPQESFSSHSAVVPPPIQLLKLLLGGAVVSDPDLSLVSLLPRHVRQDKVKPKVLVFLLDLPSPPFAPPPPLSPPDTSAGLSSSSSASGESLSSSSSSSSVEALAAHAAAFEQEALILRRVQETLRSLEDTTQRTDGGGEPAGSAAAGKAEASEEDQTARRRRRLQEKFEDAVWGNKHALPLQSSEELYRRASFLTDQYQQKEASAGLSRPPPTSSKDTAADDAERARDSSASLVSASAPPSLPHVFFEFPQLAPTLGARLKQNLRVEIDVDWAWVLKLGIACTAVQFLIGKEKEAHEGSDTQIHLGDHEPTGSRVLPKVVWRVLFSGTANRWRKRVLLSLAPLVVLSSWRPLRFTRKVLWYSLPRGRWWAGTFC